MLARAVAIYGFSIFGREISSRWKHVLYWGGLRGAIALALALVFAAARAIENQVQIDRLFAQVNTQHTQLTATLESISDGLIVCDNDGLVTQMNTQAAQILNLKSDTVVGPISCHGLRVKFTARTG